MQSCILYDYSNYKGFGSYHVHIFFMVIGILEDVNSFKVIDLEGPESLRITRLRFFFLKCTLILPFKINRSS